jgi:hypothetical protein
VVDSLKALDPEWPIREADIARSPQHVRSIRNWLAQPFAS